MPAATKSATASTSKMPPRAQFTSTTPSFMAASSEGPNIPMVSEVLGRCTVMKSAMGRMSPTDSNSSTPRAAARSGLQ